MKQFILCGLFITCASLLQAQTQYATGALMLSKENYEGTARSIAMGNAFTALGGDIGAIAINPASSGVFRYSEITFTPSITTATAKSNYLGNSMSDNYTRLGISNFGYVGSFATGRKNNGLINWNLGIVITKQNNFTNTTSASGTTNQSSWLSSLANNTNNVDAVKMDINSSNDPFYNMGSGMCTSILALYTSLHHTQPGTHNQYIAATENLNGYNLYVGGDLRQRYSSETKGNVTSSVINIGGNFSNKLFIGANIGIKSIWYRMTENYSEAAENSNDFRTGFVQFNHRYTQKISGTGFNLKAGIIYLPFSWWRLGATISTPTWMYLTDKWEESTSSAFADGYAQNITSPLGTFDYRLNTPFRFSFGTAIALPGYGALSIDYEHVDYSSAKLNDRDGDNFSFNNDNDAIKSYFREVDILRAGLELTPAKNTAIRLGYQYYSNPMASKYKYMDSEKHIGSLGFGYISSNGLFMDVAYQQLIKKDKSTFSLYDSVGSQTAPEGSLKTGWWKLLVTIGIRF